MASFPSPQRDPFLDSRIQAILSQRGKELIGVALVVLGLAFALMFATYTPSDPTWMAATDDPVQNALGRAGAAIASPFMIILGQGSWGVVLALLVWGARLILHRGDDEVLTRTVFVPIAVALTSVWLATLVSTGAFGLGGRFGDVILGALLTALPLTSTFGLNLLTLVAFAAAVAVWLHVLAVSRAETRAAGAFLLTGLVLSYAALLSLLGLSARGMGSAALRGAQGWQERRHARAEARRNAQAQTAAFNRAVQPPAESFQEPPHAQPPVWAAQRHEPDPNPPGQRRAPPVSTRPAVPIHRAEPVEPPYPPQPYPPLSDQPAHRASYAQPHTSGFAPHQAVQDGADMPSAPQPARPGLIERINPFSSRPAPVEPPEWDAPQPELVETPEPDRWQGHQGPSRDHIRARLSDVIRGRKTAKPVLRFDPDHHGAPVPPSRRGVEPPLTAQAQPVMPQPVMPVTPPQPPQSPPQSAALAPVSPPVPQPAPAGAGFGGIGFGFSLSGFQPAPQPQDDPLIDDEDPFSGYPADPAYEVPQPRVFVPERSEKPVVQPQKRKTPAPSRRAQAEAQPTLPFERQGPAFELPALSLLQDPRQVERFTLSNEALQENARVLESVLEDYGVRGEIVSVRPGPVVTMYELEPAPGLKASRVVGLADDIARSMSALSARVSTVPGRSVIGIELPNSRREKVVLREILGARDFDDNQMKLPLALGKDIGGEPIVANLAKMPHLLIAGTTGSGKSVAINTMILSLLYKLTPDECRLIMIDPKMLELSVYDGIPHLLSPVVTDPKKAVVALKWVVGEMEERYRKMSKMGVRNIDGYNGRVKEALSKGELFKRTVQTGFDDDTGEPVFETEEFAPEVLPYIVVIVDEMADLMMVAGKEIEACIQRLAQMARASGIHLIMATQRPSVDVITGTIKANFPTRISFQVTSKIDSRTILGEQGAEQLLGMGDMLYMAGGGRISRIHGPFVSDEEVEEVVLHLKSFGAPDYVSGVVEGPEGDSASDIDAVLGLGDSGGEDALYDQAVAIVARDRKCSTSYIQRKLGIGYNKAARLVEQMEDQGVVSSANHVGKREILVPEA